MNRRSMLSFLGIGAVGASTLGAQAGIVPSTHGASYGIDSAAKIAYDTKDHAVYLKDMQEQLSAITGDPSKWIADRLAEELKDWRMGYSSTHYSSIDPDIRNMKSLSESAKLRMFIERRANYKYESIKNSMFTQIQSLMKQV